jgi:aldehyde:ferredoxin oxidoreductase
MSGLCGWTGRILKIDLSAGSAETVEGTALQKKFLGGKGLNHRLAWDEIPAGAGPFDPENRLLISVGPLTGTPAPTSGRTEIGGIAAQSCPPMYSHSGVGGWFGAELKYAGYDSVVITGAAPSPVYLWINDNTVEIRDAGRLWGLGAYDTQRRLKAIHGSDVRCLVIGPAGERRSRIAILLTDTENAAGQGGFGGVAGSKNLKGICVKGTGRVRIAHPKDLLDLRRELAPDPRKNPVVQSGKWVFDKEGVENVRYPRNRTSCTHACDRGCWFEFRDVPRRTRPGLHAGRWGCIGPYTIGWRKPMGYDWPLWWQGFEGGFEATEMINQYGLNEWELLGGMVPWLVMGFREGVLTDRRFDIIKPVLPDRPEWWMRFLKAVAYRQGIGDLLAEGVSRAIDELGREQYGEAVYHGKRKVPTPISLQQAWGYAGHWSGRGIHAARTFPHWLIEALVWMTATRDPLDDTHIAAKDAWMREFDRAPYHSPAGPRIAVWNEHRSELKSSLTLCDWSFPIPAKPEAESRLFSAVTGVQMDEAALERVGERSKNMQRALLVRNHDRNRETEVNEILPWFERPDATEGIVIDAEKFNGLVDAYYARRGWDRESGRPVRATLERLDLKDVADALEAAGRLP